jgi:acyl-CoA thioester hydrolase
MTTMTNSRSQIPTDATWTHQFDLDVQIFDTDCFGVMWHGAYLKWMELGRAKLLNNMGVSIELPGQANGHVYPVSEQTLSFKNKAPYGEPLRLTTVMSLQSFKLIFEQTFRSRHPERDGQITLQAKTTVLVLDSQWKIQRRLPPFLMDALSAHLEQPLSKPDSIA